MLTVPFVLNKMSKCHTHLFVPWDSKSLGDNDLAQITTGPFHWTEVTWDGFPQW